MKRSSSDSAKKRKEKKAFDEQMSRLENDRPKRLERFLDAIDQLQRFCHEDWWFRENTPTHFAEDYRPAACFLADVASKNLCELARAGNHLAIERLAKIAALTTECLDEMTQGPNGDKAVKLLKPIASKSPSWPIMNYTQPSANKRFAVLSERLGLGKECIQIVSKSSKFDLATPINRFLWRCLNHFAEVHRTIRDGVTFKDDTTGEFVQSNEPGEVLECFIGNWITAAEIPIYATSCALPPLTKSDSERSAQAWTDKVIIPYIKLKEGTLSDFALKMGWNFKGKKVDSKVRSKVAQALNTIAPESSSP